ncbi:MAG: heme A synthase [Cyanobacteria bacterium P01_H01_bin.121]
MIDFLIKPGSTDAVEAPDTQTRVRRLARQLTIATLILMAIGSATRVMNAGLACPDWPLCYGQLIPSQQMNLQVFLEWFHRLDASLVGFGTLALLGLTWWKRAHLPFWTPWLALLALGLVAFQGLLGGLTVTELLRFDIVTAHLGTALLFFSTLLTLTLLLTPYEGTGTAGPLRWLGLVAALFVYGQSLLGAVVASRWALHQCLASERLCAVMNTHLLGVVPATLATLTLIVWAWKTPALSAPLRSLTNAALVALVGQVLLGVAALKLRLQIELLTVAHQSLGAILLGILIAFTVLAWRDQAACVPSDSTSWQAPKVQAAQ